MEMNENIGAIYWHIFGFLKIDIGRLKWIEKRRLNGKLLHFLVEMGELELLPLPKYVSTEVKCCKYSRIAFYTCYSMEI